MTEIADQMSLTYEQFSPSMKGLMIEALSYGSVGSSLFTIYPSPEKWTQLQLPLSVSVPLEDLYPNGSAAPYTPLNASEQRARQMVIAQFGAGSPATVTTPPGF